MHLTVVARRAALSAGVAGGALATLGAGTAVAAVHRPAPAIVTVHLSANRITYTGGHTRRPGPFVFDARGRGHDNTLVVLSLAKGYSMRRAAHDVNAAMSARGPADVAVVRRIDTRIHWYGGTSAPGSYAVTLAPGRYLMINERAGKAIASLRVVGPRRPSAAERSAATIDAISAADGDRFATPATLPHAGWVTFADKTDEPHFLDLTRVTDTTTDADVAAHINDPQPPSFVLPQTAQSGPISPGQSIGWHYSLPPGRYLMACFWPSDDNGLPHAAMGMWALVTLT